MFVDRTGHMKLLTNDPLGVQMIVGALVLQVIGHHHHSQAREHSLLKARKHDS